MVWCWCGVGFSPGDLQKASAMNTNKEVKKSSKHSPVSAPISRFFSAVNRVPFVVVFLSVVVASVVVVVVFVVVIFGELHSIKALTSGTGAVTTGDSAAVIDAFVVALAGDLVTGKSATIEAVLLFVIVGKLDRIFGVCILEATVLVIFVEGIRDFLHGLLINAVDSF